MYRPIYCAVFGVAVLCIGIMLFNFSMSSAARPRSKSPLSPTKISRTEEKKAISGEVTWIIDDMLEKMDKFEPGQSIKTDTITIMGTKWSFMIYPNGKWGVKGNIVIVIELLSGNGKEVTADCEFKVGKTEDGWLKVSDVKRWTFRGIGLSFQTFPHFTINHTEVIANKERAIRFGKMEFSMKVTLKGKGSTFTQVNLQKETVFNSMEDEGLRELSLNLASLLWDEGTSDFQIICGDESFPVHRMVLGARSSYFQVLFNRRFVESETGQVNIEDMASETLKAVIEYMYTGKFKDIESKARELLVASERFDLLLLKKYCEEWLISNLKKDNAVDLFILADEQNSEKLRLKAKQMIVENGAEIINQDGWKTKLGTLVIELFEACFK